MPELLDLMLPRRPRNLVDDLYLVRLHEPNLPPMREPAIRALCVEVVLAGRRLPCPNAHLWLIAPAERPAGNGLIAPVNPNRVVCAGTAKPVARLFIANVCIRARVDQNVSVSRARHNAERVGVAVARTPRPERSGVD